MTATATLPSVVSDAIRRTFPESVNKFPLFGPDQMPTNGLYGLWTSDGEQVGGSVKSGYHPHTLEDVEAFATAAVAGMDAGDMLDVRCRWNAGHEILIAPTREKRREIFGTQDAIFPMFSLRAGYDGRAFTGSVGLKRDACDNLMMLTSAGEQFTQSIRHTESMVDRLPAMISKFRMLAGKWDRIAEICAQMQERELAVDDYLGQVFPEVDSDNARTRKSARKRVRAIINRITDERFRLSGRFGSIETATAWELFNGVQGYAQHDKSRKGRPDAQTRAFVAMSDPIVNKALEIATAA